MADAGDARAGIAAAVINFNTAALTRACTRSLEDAGIATILVLDNASGPEDFALLQAQHAASGDRVRIVRSEENLGFARGSNLLLEEALRDPGCERVLMVNSDAIVDPRGLAACLEAMREGGFDLMGGRMLKPAANGAPAGAVDSLGITLYKSLLASNRMSAADRYLGPTGGFAIYSRRFLDEVKNLHGYVFDPSYFCYAEDTDLCLRARLLGHKVGYTDEVVAYHAGQASNAGQYNDFILYHGIRNSIWMAAKSIPLRTLLTHLHWFIVLHGGIVMRHTVSGRWRTLLRLYRDAALGLPATLKKRRAVQSSRRVTLGEFNSHIDPHFYETKFLKDAVRDLFRGT